MASRALVVVAFCAFVTAAGCGGGTGGEQPDGGTGLINTCANLTTLRDSCDDADNSASCKSVATAGDDAKCDAQYLSFLEACSPESAECERLQKVCVQCTDPNDANNCSVVANGSFSTPQGCLDFDFARFGSCPD